MDQGGVTWIIAADAHEARIFEEKMRAGPVHEIFDRHMSANSSERGAGRKQQATVHARSGSARHAAGAHDPGEEATRRFLHRVAESLAESARRGAFDSLVLMAPPKALGLLRQALPPQLAARVEAADPHERKADTAEDIRHHLHQARARA